MLTVVCRIKVSNKLYFYYLSMPKKDVLIKFGEKVRSERMRQGLSQEELAYRAGVHRTYIGMIERAEKNITLINIYKITKALNLKASDFFEYDNEA